MQVTVMRMNHSSAEVSLRPGATVRDAISEAGFAAAGNTLTLNGSSTTLDTQVSAGSIVTLIPKVEGGACDRVKVIRLNHGSQFENLRYNDTVGNVLARLGIDPTGHSLSLNTESTTTGARLDAGDVITLTPKVKGGN